MAGNALFAKGDTPRNARTSTATASERSDDAPDCSIKVGIGRSSIFTKDTSASIGEFPHLVSYSRFVQLKKEVLTLLTLYLHAHLGECSGISFVDSTRLRVCDNKRISSHRVFAEMPDAQRPHGSTVLNST